MRMSAWHTPDQLLSQEQSKGTASNVLILSCLLSSTVCSISPILGYRRMHVDFENAPK